MSTEAPAAVPPPEVKAAAIEGETKRGSAPPTKENPITFNMSEVLKNVSAQKASTRAAVPAKEPEKKPDAVTPPPEENKPEQVTPPPAAEAKKEEIPERPNAEHFKKVVSRAEAAEARAKELEAQLETARTTPPAEVATKLSDYEKQLEEFKKQNEELRGKVREVDVTLDPMFEKEFTQPVQTAQMEVLNLLTRAGADPNEAKAAVLAWDDAAFAEVTANMTDIQKRRVDAAILETERLAKVRQAQITKPEDFAAKQRQRQEENSRQATSERQRHADRILQGLLESTPAFKEPEHAPMYERIKSEMARGVKGEMTPAEVLGKIAQAEALQMAVVGQHTVLEQQAARIAELEKENEDLNTFVKNNAGGTLKSEANGGTPSNGEYVPLSKRITVKV